MSTILNKKEMKNAVVFLATDGSTIEDEWIAYYVDDYTAYEMLYTDSDY